MTSPGFPAKLHYAGPRPNPEMSQDFTLWKSQIRLALGRLCALDFPRGVPAQEATNAGFHAVMQGLYGECHFTEFLSYQAWRQAGVDEPTGQVLQALQEDLDCYDEPDTDAAIVADPAWWAIVGQASEVVKRLN
jgi:hypothetical protein